MSKDALKCLATSLEDFNSLVATLHKNQTLQVVRDLGLSAPAGNSVTIPEDVMNFAQHFLLDL